MLLPNEKTSVYLHLACSDIFSDVTADDVEIVRLSLLWTVLLLTERASMFYAYAEPKEFYARLTEVFLLGIFLYFILIF